MNRRKIFGVAVAVLALVALAGAEEKRDDRYVMNARALVVDNCDVICPCLFGNEPSHGHCRNLAVVELEGGHLGGVDLKGVRWAMLGQFSGEVRKGPTWGYHAFYVDSRASAPQREAMKRILAAPPFSKLGDDLGLVEIPIDLDVADGPLGAWSVKVGDKGSFTAEPIPGGDPKRPQAVENPVYPFPAEKVILAKAKGEFHDHGKDLVLEANSGEIARWTLEGDAAATAPPSGSIRK